MEKIEKLLLYFINSEKMIISEREYLFFNISIYFREMLKDKKKIHYFYKVLLKYIVELPSIDKLNFNISLKNEELEELAEKKAIPYTDDELIQINAKRSLVDRDEVNQKYNLVLKELNELRNYHKNYLSFFDKDLYYLLNNIYYNYHLIQDLFIEFLKTNKNNEFMTILIYYSKKKITLDLLKDILLYYNIDKTQTSIIISLNVVELNKIILSDHSEKILKYNDIFNTLYLIEKENIDNIKVDNKYIKYITEYLKRNDFET